MQLLNEAQSIGEIPVSKDGDQNRKGQFWLRIYPIFLGCSACLSVIVLHDNCEAQFEGISVHELINDG